MAATTAADKSKIKEKNQNIQVFVRLRPLNQRERTIRSLSAVEVVNNREVVVRQSQSNSFTKRFTFDRAFGPNAQQVEVYKDVVSPLIAEVLAGYNCTVFAYGQTGTGKTHTMVGESSGEGCSWQNDPLAGMIPRALSHLFDELRISQTDYKVCVSYLELYNEELFDLLSSSVDNSKLKIYEDGSRKGSTIVNGLEEVEVRNKNEVYDIMGRGQERKKVASTLLNSQSSRSHTVFTILVQIKESSSKGEEMMKIGKLNLVDLAGSENISKAGSDNPAKKERARECVNINQSLLTLGRVITALVEKHPHIPYRESKLTRILQESLGGRTKTSIIATISPGHKDLEETLSTLEYAHRARNIQNKPEINQKLTSQAILKSVTQEMEKLKRDLYATREKNGIYLSQEDYEELTLKHEEQQRELQEFIIKMRAMDEERERMQAALNVKREELDATAKKLELTEQERLEQQTLAEKHAATESQLTRQAQLLMKAAAGAAGDVNCLHDTVARRRNLESENLETVRKFREHSTAQRCAMIDGANHLYQGFADFRDQLQTAIDDRARDTIMTQEMTVQDTGALQENITAFLNEIKTITTSANSQLSQSSSECKSTIEQTAQNRQQALQHILERLVSSVASSVDKATSTDLTATVQKATDQWLSGAIGRVNSLERAQASHVTATRATETARLHTAREHHRQIIAELDAEEQLINDCIQKLEQNKRQIEESLSEQMAAIEAERLATEQRLQTITQAVETVRSAISNAAETQKNKLESLKRAHEETTEQYLELQRKKLEAKKRKIEMENQYLEMCEQDSRTCLRNGETFDQDFGEGASAVSAEMESFGHSVVQIVDHTSSLLVQNMKDAHQHIQKSVQEAISSEAEATQQLVQSTSEAVESVATTASEALTKTVLKTEETTTSAIESLQTMSERSARLLHSTQSAQNEQTSKLSHAAATFCSATDDIRSRLADHADLEARYLMKEFKVYTPTGSTPDRREFRFPRRLAATSPRDRILARLRNKHNDNNRRHSPDSDCMVVESDSENRHSSDSDEVSESTSTVSEDSAVAMQ